MESFVSQFLALGGVGALIAALVNILKTVNVVKPEGVSTWVVGLNLLGMAGLLAVKVFQPDLDIAGIDQQAAGLATVLVTVFGFIWQLISSRLAHNGLKGAPVVGTSFSVEAAKAKAFEERILRREFDESN